MIVIIIILATALLFFTGGRENSVSNLYIIPSGTFSPSPEKNMHGEQDVVCNISGCVSEDRMLPGLLNQTNASIIRKNGT